MIGSKLLGYIELKQARFYQEVFAEEREGVAVLQRPMFWHITCKDLQRNSTSTGPTWLPSTPPCIGNALSARLRARLTLGDGLRPIMTNIGGLMADNIMRMVLGVLVGAWVARYLGSERFWGTGLCTGVRGVRR